MEVPTHCNGSTFNLMIERENGEVTTEPLQVIAKGDQVSCAIYERENDMLFIRMGWNSSSK